jgi:hypothetical protein
MTIRMIKLNRNYMKKIIICIIIFAVTLLAPQITRAQGTTYLSNLGQTSAGSVAVGSDSWLAILFIPGKQNLNGYTLNSIQLALTDATGNPSDFTVMIWNGLSPASSLGTLNGSADPAAGDIYTYTAPSSLTLMPGTDYYIVLTAGTAVANGAYEWSFTGTTFDNPIGGWLNGLAAPEPVSTSIDGSSWSEIKNAFPQFAINATPIPEPSPSWLILLGSGVLLYARRFCKKN